MKISIQIVTIAKSLLVQAEFNTVGNKVHCSHYNWSKGYTDVSSVGHLSLVSLVFTPISCDGTQSSWSETDNLQLRFMNSCSMLQCLQFCRMLTHKIDSPQCL